MKMIEKIKGFVKRLFKGRMKMRTLTEMAIDAIFVLILIIAYIIVGLIIAVPYIYLAGWEADKIVSAVVFAPLIAAVLCLFFLLGKAERHSSYSRFKVFNTTFWIGIVYFLLPVIANGVSILLNWLELPYGDLIFEYRYQTFLVLPIIILILLVCGILENIWTWLFSKKTDNQELLL